ncbi:hypothetical protein DL767_000580 [Monosporascus sp. MG133]|nr:hypothetical protein DL767_000580 [Monosporascus sp. MG133]
MDGGKEAKSVCDLVERWAHTQPDHVAISFGSKNVSYGQLEDAASHVAWLLQQNQVLPGDFVPVLATRSIEMVACFLGVLKAGACYVPIDVETWSEERIATTLKTVSARVVINLGTPARALYLPEYNVVSGSNVKAALEPTATEQENRIKQDRRQPEIKPSDLAYMIFTSGTTSAPKGVMIPHSAILNYAQQGDDETPFNFNANPDDKVLLLFSPGFDACVAVMVSALCNGAQVVVASAYDLLECAARSTILVATPSVLTALGEPEDTFDKVRTIILGGEAPSQSLLRKWWTPTRSIYNAYGLTETTIMSLIGRAVPWKPVTLGQPMQGSRVVLLSDGDLSNAETDDCDFGEMCITGPGLAVGFYQNEALTAEKFITLKSGERAYRTGDFARRTEHGLEFAGRIDSLVKNRGFLINLEAQVVPALLAQGAFEAAALMHQKQLVGIVTPETQDIRALRQALARKHEDFLVPDQIRALKALPLTVNGKTDTHALRRLLEAEERNEKNHSNPAHVGLHVFPGQDGHSARERMSRIETLKAAVAAATSLPLDYVAEDCSFWELGGNSLAAIRVLSYLRKRNLTIGLKAVFDLPDLNSVCNALQEIEAKGTDGDGECSEPMDKGEAHISKGPMTSLQTKMVQGSIKTPGLNYMLLHLRIPFYPATTSDIERMKAAWNRALQRHSAFRTSFLLKEGLQKIRPQVNLDWSHEETTSDRADAVIHARSHDLRRQLMAADESSEDLYVPVNAFRLITVPGQASTLLMAVHHAQVDGWSLSIVFNEVQAALQGGGRNASPPSLSFRPDQFVRVALAQKQLQSDPSGVAFWARALLENQAAFPELGLPKSQSLSMSPATSVSAAAPSSSWMSNHTLSLDLCICDLENAARRFRVVPSTLVYATWGLVLSNYTFSDRVAFGAVLSGRNLITKAVPDVDMDVDVESVVGPLINTVPFPIQFGNEQQTISEFVSSIHSHLMETVEFQWSAAEAMAAMTGESINGIMHTVIATEYDVPPLHGNWSVERQDFMVEFGLSLMVEKKGQDGLQVRVLFDAARYAPSGVRSILLHFRNALKGFMDPRNMYVQDVRAGLLEDSERAALIRPPAAEAQYSGPRTVKDALEVAAAKWPELCAVESTQDGTMSYRELDEASNKLARALRGHLKGKAPRDVVVCVLTDRSLHWIVAVVAVIKAGCVCCPLDVTLPERRVETIVKQSGASIFVSANRQCMSAIEFRRQGIAHLSDVCIVVDEFLQGAAQHDSTPVETVTHTADVIYLVFTSGTTGVPKGFDIATLEMFGTLCYGGTLVLKEHTDPFEHLKRVHAAIMTPSVLSACLPAEYPHLDTIVVGGEPVPQSMTEVWGAGRSLINGYGPSECGSISTTAQLLPGHKVTIGHELPRVSVYVLDHRQCPVAQGVTGEICISGEQITREYWGDSGRDEVRHVPNPFASSQAQQLMYRTGDLGYWDDEMNLNYVGRIDNQVKVRGFRVELEEIEHVILATDLDPCVQNAIVMVVDDHAKTRNEDNPREQSEGDKRVVGFVTPQNVNLVALRARIAAVLPSHMRPSQMMALSELPKTSNYKADRKALAALAVSEWSGRSGRSGSASDNSIQAGDGENGEASLTATERMISKTWKELLHLDPHFPLQKDQDFLTIGGNSVLAIRAARKLASSIGRHVPVALLLRTTVLKELARAIDQYGTPSLSANPQTESFSAYLSSSIPHTAPGDVMSNSPHLSYMEEELFYSHRASDTRSAFNTIVQFVLRGAIDTEALVKSFTAVQRENPILRARYTVDTQGRPCRVTSDDVAYARCFVGDEWNDDQMQALVDTPFDMARDQLLRLVIWDRSDDNSSKDGVTNIIEVTIMTHHIVTDRASLSLLLQSLSCHYQDIRAQRSPDKTLVTSSGTKQKLGLRKIGYADWARWLQIYQQTPRAQMQLQKKLAFWRETLGSMQQTRMLPRDHLGHHGHSKETVAHLGSSQHVSIPCPDGCTGAPYSQRLAVAATALALRAVFATSDVTLAIPYMNRDDPATAGMMGLFVDRLPIRLALSAANLASADALLNLVASVTHRAVEQQVPYAQIRSQFASSNDHFIDVLVIYNWQSDALETALALGPDVQVTQLSAARAARPKGAMFPLLFDYSEQEDGGLGVHIEYNPDLVPARTVAALISLLPGAVQGLARQETPANICSGDTSL